MRMTAHVTSTEKRNIQVKSLMRIVGDAWYYMYVDRSLKLYFLEAASPLLYRSIL